MTFIVIEGQDYVGKSTQVRKLVERLKSENYNVFATRSPGGCEDAEAVREFMLKSPNLSPDFRNILAGLSRKLTSEVINKFLSETPVYNKVVVSDRWITSGYAYQVSGEGVSTSKFIEANTNVTVPTLEIRLLMSAKDRAARKQQMETTNRDVMEVLESDKAFAQRVQKTFETLSYGHPVEVIHVGLNDTPEMIHEAIWKYVQEVLNP